MAVLQLKPPEPFNFKTPDEWPRWRKRFEQFRIASGLSEDSVEKQISTLLYCLGEEAESVLSSADTTADDQKDYKKITDKLDEFFKVRHNVIYERAQFNRRSQQPGETTEQFIMALYELAENCDYDRLKDRIVVGIRDNTLSERLQLDSELTLEKAKRMVRQRKAVHEQAQSLGASSTIAPLQPDRSHGKQHSNKRGTKVSHRGKQPATTNTKTKCSRCGKEPHSREKRCCKKCGKANHFAVMCRTKTVGTDEITGSCDDIAFLDQVTPQSSDRTWLCRIKLCGQTTTFKIDTGAEVTAISTKTYDDLGRITLNTPDRKLLGPSTQPLEVLGSFNGQVTHKEKSSHQIIYVIKGLKITY